MTAPIYFTDAAGERWHVYDIADGPIHCRRGPFTIYPLGDHRARYRLFVNAEGWRWAYTLPKGAGPDERSTDPATLERQRQAAPYVPLEAFHAGHEYAAMLREMAFYAGPRYVSMRWDIARNYAGRADRAGVELPSEFHALCREQFSEADVQKLEGWRRSERARWASGRTLLGQ